MRSYSQNLSREKYLDNIAVLLQTLQQDKQALARPYIDVFAYFLLPIGLWQAIDRFKLLSPLVNTSAFKGIVLDILIQKKINPATLYKNYLDALHNLKLIEAKLLSEIKALVIRDPQLSIDFNALFDNNVIAWPTIETASQLTLHYGHPLLKVARYIDTLAGNSPLAKNFKMAYHLILSLSISGLSGIGYEQPELAQQLKEFNSIKDLSQTTTYRLAEMTQSFYPKLFEFKDKVTPFIERNEKLVSAYVLSGCGLLFGLTSSMFLKGVVVKPLITKILPLQLYLPEPTELNAENYKLYDAKSLQREQAKLKRAHETLLPYIKKSQFISNGIRLLFGLSLIVVGWEQPATPLMLVYIPLFFGYLLEYLWGMLVDRRDRKNVVNQLNVVKAKLAYILGPAAKCVKIVATDRGRLSLSTLRIKVTNSHRSDLTAPILADLIKQTLVHFNISLLASYTRQEFSIMGHTPLAKLELMKQFFARALQRGVDLAQLKYQMRSFLKILESKDIIRMVTLDHEGLQTVQYLFGINAYPQQIQKILHSYGFELSAHNFSLARNQPFPEEIFNDLVHNLKRALVSNVPQRAMPLPITKIDDVPLEDKRVGKKNNKPNISQTIEPIPVQAAVSENIKWPGTKAVFPKNVVKVHNGIKKYLWWTLQPEDFGSHQAFYQTYKDKGTQYAGGFLNKSGIKERPVAAVYQNRTRLFPAYIKVPGTNTGNSGVILESVRNEQGDTLFITRAFEPNIHQKLRK